jgi:hypothetical protein
MGVPGSSYGTVMSAAAGCSSTIARRGRAGTWGHDRLVSKCHAERSEASRLTMRVFAESEILRLRAQDDPMSAVFTRALHA